MIETLKRPAFFAALASASLIFAAPASAAGGGVEIPRQDWSFSGPFGQFDRAQLQRGFQVYQNVCAACHSIDRVRFRNLAEPGGPAFPEESVKALAAEWPNEVEAGPNDDGEMFTRPALLSDAIPGPYKNAKQAQAAQGGAYPPDLSLIAKARTTDYTGSVWYHPIHMLKDIVTAYQEGGPDYLYALLTGYRDEPPAFMRMESGDLKQMGEEDGAGSPGRAIERCASMTDVSGDGKDICNTMQEGMHYNTAFPGHQIKMMKPLSDGLVTYNKGEDGKPLVPETTEQYARDVVAFLAWAADPSHDQRKRAGWLVMLYLLIATVLLYFAKKAIWKDRKK